MYSIPVPINCKMSKYYINIYMFAVMLFTVNKAVLADEVESKASNKTVPRENLTCKGEPLDKPKLMFGKRECADDFLATHKSTTPVGTYEYITEISRKLQDNIMCLDVCAWKKQNFLNTDGTYNSNNTIATDAFPSGVQENIKKAFDECASENGKSFSLDKECSGYHRFWYCRVKKFMEICAINKEHPSDDYLISDYN